MVMDDFESIVAHFNPLDVDQYAALATLTQNYPYFATAWAYLAKAAQAQKKIDAEKTIEQAAVLAYDRTVFKDWMDAEIPTKKENHITAPKKEKLKNKIPKQDLQKKSNSSISPKKNKNEPTKSTQKSQPTLRSFVEWLDHQKEVEPVPKAASIPQKEKANEDVEEKWELIDAFIENNPKISTPDPNRSLPNLTAEQSVMKEELMTETLARILVQQNKFAKALQAYKILSLKYPEKNSFFASQIKEIKRLQQAKQ